MGTGSRSAIVTAVRSTAHHDRSRVLRSYAVVGVLVTLFASSLILLALPGWVARTDGTSATLMLAPGLLLIGGIIVVAALLAPLFLAVRRVPSPGENRRIEAVYGGFGYAFVSSLYVAMIISAPADTLGSPPGGLTTVVEALNALDPLLGVVPPLAVLVAFVLVDRQIAA